MRLAASLRAGLLGSAVAVLAVVGARAAELPSMKPARPEAVKACNIGGMAGVVIAGTGTCVKIGGYLSVGVASGGVRP